MYSNDSWSSLSFLHLQVCLPNVLGPWGLRSSKPRPGPHGTSCYPACTAATAVHAGLAVGMCGRKERAGATARITMSQDRASSHPTLRWMTQQHLYNVCKIRFIEQIWVVSRDTVARRCKHSYYGWGLWKQSTNVQQDAFVFSLTAGYFSVKTYIHIKIAYTTSFISLRLIFRMWYSPPLKYLAFFPSVLFFPFPEYMSVQF